MTLTKATYAMINGAPVNVLDYGATADGVTDDSAAFIAARAAANGKKIYVPAGTYKLNAVVTGSTDLILEGDGPSTVLDFTGTVSGGSYALDAVGTATQIEALSGTQTVGTNTVTFASAPSLSVGDVFVIYNPTDYSWSGFRANYFAGEWCEVESIAGNVITVRNPLYDTYAAANVDVYKITGPKVALRNFAIRGTTVFGLIRASLCIAPLIENITASHANNAIVFLDRCFKPTVINPDVSNVGTGSGDDYGIVIGSSQHAKIIGGNIYARRHAVTTGGGAEICDVPVRDARIIGATLKNDIASDIFCADFHGNTEDSSYIDCTIYGGATWQGKDIEYVNCEITADGGGRVIYSAEIKGGTFALKNCKLVTYVNPVATSRAIVDIGGNNSPVTSSTTIPCTFTVENCTLYGRNLSASTTFVGFTNRGTTVATNFNINGVTADVDGMSNILRTNSASGTPDADFIIVDNVAGFPSGTYLHAPAGGFYLNFPHRCQKQSGRVTLSATTGQYYDIATPVAFKYPYPRYPFSFAVSGGNVGQTYIGNRTAIANLYRVTTTEITPQIATGDGANWSNTENVNVSWLALLDEV